MWHVLLGVARGDRACVCVCVWTLSQFVFLTHFSSSMPLFTPLFAAPPCPSSPHNYATLPPYHSSDPVPDPVSTAFLYSDMYQLLFAGIIAFFLFFLKHVMKVCVCVLCM